MTIGNSAFCLFLYLTGVHFRGELQHGGNVSQQKIKCRPIRTREIGGASLSDVLYVRGRCLFEARRLLEEIRYSFLSRHPSRQLHVQS